MTNPEFVQALERAKDFLWDGKGEEAQHQSRNICGCLPRNPAGAALRRLIMERIHPYGVVRGWLANKAGVPREERTDENVQAYRLAWINKLIEEFS